IERVVEGEPQPWVLEFRPANIEGESLHHAGIADREFLEQDAFVGHRREIVSRRPVLGAVLVSPIDGVGLERFEGDGGVAEVKELQLVEIVDSDIDVQIARPMILHAFVDDAAAGGKILDAIGPAAERRLERGLADIALFAVGIGSFPPMLWQDGKLTDDLRQFAIAWRVEHEGDLVVAGFFRLGDVPVIGRKLWTVLPERIERKNHVLRPDRLPVPPFALPPQPGGDRGGIRWKTYSFR